MASAGETGPGAGTAGRGPRADERAPGWLVFSLLPPHTALQPSLLPSWLLIRTQPQAEARVTPSARVPAVRARTAACPSVQSAGRTGVQPGTPPPPRRACGVQGSRGSGMESSGHGCSERRARKRGAAVLEARLPDPGGGASPRTFWTDFPSWPFSPPPDPEGFGSSEMTSCKERDSCRALNKFSFPSAIPWSGHVLTLIPLQSLVSGQRLPEPDFYTFVI